MHNRKKVKQKMDFFIHIQDEIDYWFYNALLLAQTRYPRLLNAFKTASFVIGLVSFFYKQSILQAAYFFLLSNYPLTVLSLTYELVRLIFEALFYSVMTTIATFCLVSLIPEVLFGILEKQCVKSFHNGNFIF
jgi:hypothetical protein